LSERDTGFCHSIFVWHDRRRLSAKQIETLHHGCRNAARRAIAAECRARRHMATVVPANTMPV
jgi:hypothetical protein